MPIDLRARLIAIYLPQYHPIPENDAWWGKGFTEWTNVAKAKPLFKGHYQPKLPADLGFYDLRVPEVREAQAELARSAGIEGFCYYHYWFGGKSLLERPFNEVVATGKPDFPFCLCWANQTWTGIWHGAPNRILIEQTYSDAKDNQKHFLSLRNALLDKRYMRVEGRPIFVIYRPTEMPDVAGFIRQWQDLAVQNGLPGLHFVAYLAHREPTWDYRLRGFDSCVVVGTHKIFSRSLHDMFFDTGENRYERNGGSHRADIGRSAASSELAQWLWRRARLSAGKFANVRLYRHALPFLLEGCRREADVYPCVTPNWDNSARSGLRSYVLHDSTPGLFRIHLRDALTLIESRPFDRRLVFIKSWNEWAEGNYLEPDQKFGLEYLKVIQEEISL